MDMIALLYSFSVLTLYLNIACYISADGRRQIG